ncbi:TolB family protein [Nocardia wallacei]|uniref:TolB family protein n=1 Tax=Nocardia wallacei TaxID=480035 RepID=UPI0024580B62|nr:hypothetical protein [Nocardia wallacei]
MSRIGRSGARIVSAGGRRLWAVSVAVVTAVLVSGCAKEAGPPPHPARIAFADDWQSVFVMNPDGTGVVRIGAGSDPSFSPDGSKIAFTRADTLWLMNADGSEARQLLSDGFYNSEPVFTRDGSAIVFTSNRGGKNRSEIYETDLEGRRVRQLIDEAVGHPALSRDGTEILFTRFVRDAQGNGGAEVWAMHRDGGNPHRLTDPKQVAQSPSWGAGTVS